jgi:hypothetical protein
MAAVVIVTWPDLPTIPLPGLDQSWFAMLHMAATRRMQSGRDIVFTYGPLGFLSVPTLHSTPTAILAWLYGAFVHVSLVVLVVVCLRAWVRPWIAAAIGLVVVDLALLEPAELAVIIVMLLCALLIQERIAEQFERQTFVMLGAIAAVQLLLKFNTGVACIALVAVTALASSLANRSRQAIALSASAFVATLAVLWVALGQSLSGFVNFVARSVAMTSGYSGAMAIEDPSRHREYWWAFVVVAIIVAAMWLASKGRSRLQRLALASLVAVFLYFDFRRGFVRHDAHSYTFFVAAVAVPIALRWPTRRVVAGVASIAACLMFLVGALSPSLVRDLLNPTDRMGRLHDQVATLTFSRDRHRVTAQGVAATRAASQLSPAVLAAIRGTVHVDPVDTAIVWAYGFRWRPEPVPQAYSAYTPSLDNLNARALRSPRAPDTVLRPSHPGAIDRRHPMFESPAAMKALACRYRVVVDDGRWQVLRHGTDRCGRSQVIRTVAAANGSRIEVPAAPPDMMVVARITIRSTLKDRIREVLFKPRRRPHFIDANGAFRFVAATANDPHIVRLPNASRIASGEGNGQMNVDWFRIDNVTGSVRVTFEAVPFKA